MNIIKKNFNKNFNKFIRIGVVFLLIYCGLLIISPFISAILSGAILAYIFHPVYKKVFNLFHKKAFSSFIVIFLVILIIFIPISFTIKALIQETSSLSKYVKEKNVLLPNIQNYQNCSDESILCYYFQNFKEISPNFNPQIIVEDTLNKLTNKLINYTISVPAKIFDFFIALFVMFFLLIDGKYLVEEFWKITLFKDNYKKNITQNINDITYGVVYGSVIVAIIQGVLGMLGFYIFGVGSPIIWGIVMIFLSMLPYFGASIVWAPASAFILINGITNHETFAIWRGIGLFLYGLLLVSTIDNLLKPKIIGSKAKIHPVIFLLGVFGGLSIFGFMGFILGPLILALCVEFIVIVQNKNR